MAQRDRVHSLETEYAVAFFSDDQPPSASVMIDALMTAAGESHGTAPGSFLINGSRLSHDVGHAEWALPECRTARELAVYDKATDHLLLHRVVPRAGAILAVRGFDGQLVVTKNNVDSFGSTYGCHENYQMQRDSELLTWTDFVRYMTQALIPFLVSRQILVGAGRLVHDTGRGPGQLHYEIAQRSGFLQTVVSRSTTQARPILNLGREGEPLADGNNRRLHLILGDANLSGWATWIKTGSTGLLLRLIEDLFLDDVPVLQDPVAAVKAIACDRTGQETVPLQSGGRITALDMQWFYYDLIDAYLTLFGASGEDETLMEAWGAGLEDFERDPLLLRDRADWAIKQQMIDTTLEQHGTSLADLPADRTLINDLKALDLRYHELSPGGLYHRLHPADTLVTPDEIAQAQAYPPPYTRARIRGEVVRLSRDGQAAVGPRGWTAVSLEGTEIALPDPLCFDHPALAAWDCVHPALSQTGDAPIREDVVRWFDAALQHPNSDIRHGAVEAAAGRQGAAWVLPRLIQVAQHDFDPHVRRAAVLALGRSSAAGSDVTEALIACLRDPNPVVSWAAEASLNRLARPGSARAEIGTAATESDRADEERRARTSRRFSEEPAELPDWLTGDY